MCGITGFWNPSRTSERQLRTALDQMLDVLDHRGPDDRGSRLYPEKGLALGHTRLSIVGLDHGHQPIESRDGELAVTVNGELYGYKKLRTQLACETLTTGGKSDSAITLPLYRKYGLSFVEHLRGEFAVVLYDARENRLILIRDRFGVKPLYYSVNDNGIAWGSEVKSILKHPDIQPRMCPKAVIHQMMQVMVPGSTAFEDVQALQPGHMLIVQERDGRLETSLKRWWDLEFPESHVENADPAEYVQGVQDRLIDAVATRLEADVPVGCYLSGGIDSCSILGLATTLQQSPIKAFTIAFDSDEYDESNIAKLMAQRTGAEQELLLLTEKELYGPAFERATWHAERTFYNTLAVAKWHMSRRVRACNYKAVITGEGSDELFGGYPFFKRDWLGREDDAGIFAGAILAEEDLRHPAWDDLCGFTPSWIQPWMMTLARVRPLLSSSMQDLMQQYDPVAEVAGAIDPDQVRGRHRLDVSQYTWCKTMLEGQILTWGGDRMDMANSMEARPAFLDHHIAEYAVTIPPDVRIRDGIEKWVLREAMVNVLPRELYERKKFAFMAPPAHTSPVIRAALQDMIDHWLTDARIAALGVFDTKKLRDFIDQAWQETDHTIARRNDIIMNHALQLHILHGQYVEGMPLPAVD
ncbi:Asparagine synthetase [glutamine-hydrolyzing] 1 [Rosistilla oblonga]|uniref:asparagine synthase (glutamine-hydrolyzing) n=1 Tax=Rosistilla oblonga TaxID=2527990 RepID=A0A518ISB1_9BACT|nr:asparagine synthase (glutamine-hydrolyzing) [Rosistilla oblonga]QDV12011.1 Asparagine synthetase [glutamine-hydrolyzing] 1 [Rosistilla oblonga]QDV55961.1 Asparagine synthetase [glutamine-hydrolyzing] 1 [Rosistilla oblonga]